MFRLKCFIFRENKIPVLKISCLWKAVIVKVLRSAAAALFTFLSAERTTEGILKICS
jgi:hypothetical protein